MNEFLIKAQKMKFSIKDFFSKCDQSRSLLIWLHLLNKSLMENSIICIVNVVTLLNFCRKMSEFSSEYSYFIHPENTRKSKVFYCFPGV